MATPYAKTWARVFGECQGLTALDRRAFSFFQDRTPPLDETCAANEAFLLYLADVLKFEGHQSLDVATILRHFLTDLARIGANLALAILERQPELPVYRLSISDGRYVSLTGVQSLLDTETWDEVPGPVSEVKLVSYNLTSLMLVRWAGVPLSPRLETSEPTDDSAGAAETPPGD